MCAGTRWLSPAHSGVTRRANSAVAASFLALRRLVVLLTNVGLCPAWVELLVNNLLKGGVAWADAEKAKIADLNWRITVEKPL